MVAAVFKICFKNIFSRVVHTSPEHADPRVDALIVAFELVRAAELLGMLGEEVTSAFRKRGVGLGIGRIHVWRLGGDTDKLLLHFFGRKICVRSRKYGWPSKCFDIDVLNVSTV